MLVTKWEKESRNFRKQNAGETTYSTAVVENEKLFQIQTYGSLERQMKGTVSQTIQFNKKQACELIEILKKEFII